MPRTASVGLAALDATGHVTPLPKVQVSGDGAEVRSVAAGPIATYEYRATGQRATLHAAAAGFAPAEAALAIGPSASRVAVSCDPARPVKGRDHIAKLSVDMFGADGKPDPEAAPPVLRANVGSVDGLAAAGPGRFQAVYHLPEAPQPEVAIVVAFAPWPHEASTEGGFGSLIVPLATAFKLGGKTDANAEVTVEIAGQTFGPIRSDASGHFELPVVAPPGHRVGMSTAVDRLGNRRRKPLDLRLPPTDQIACVANPVLLAADGISRARILCVATDPLGAVVRSARLTATAKLGRIEGPRDLGAGTYEWTYGAPPAAAAAADEILCTYPAGGPTSRVRVPVELAPPPPARLEISVEPSEIFMNGPGALVRATARDNRGGALPSARIECHAERGTLKEAPPAGAERRWSYAAPSEAVAGERITCRALRKLGQSVAAIHLWVERPDAVGEVVDIAGQPVAGVGVRAGSLREITNEEGRFRVPNVQPPGLVVQLESRNSVAASLHLLPGTEGLLAYPIYSPPAPVSAEHESKLLPAAPVDVQLQVSGRRVNYRVVDVGTGKVLPGRKVTVHVANGTAGPLHETGDGGGSFEVTPAGNRAAVSVADDDTRITAVVSLTP
jgi:hypothetical protein